MQLCNHVFSDIATVFVVFLTASYVFLLAFSYSLCFWAVFSQLCFSLCLAHNDRSICVIVIFV